MNYIQPDTYFDKMHDFCACFIFPSNLPPSKVKYRRIERVRERVNELVTHH